MIMATEDPVSIEIPGNSHVLSMRNDELLFPYLKKYGSDFMAYSGLQPGLEYFLMDNIGYIAFRRFHHPILAPKGISFVISDPICARDNYETIIAHFLERMGKSSFLMVTKEVAMALRSFGLHINQFGAASEIDVQSFNIKGKEKEHLRRWKNKAAKEGVEVIESDVRYIEKAQLEKVNSEWIRKKGGKEYILMHRPFMWDHEEDVRFFWALKEGELVGMVGFDPMYKDNKVVGYYKNFLRMSDDAPHGTSVLVTLAAIEKFRYEGGIERVCFGISPFSNLNRNDLNDSNTLYLASRFMHKYCGFIYPFKGNEFHKKRYGGAKKEFYYSSLPEGSKIMQLLTALKALGCF